MSELALFGGPRVRNTLFPAYKTIGPEEEGAVRQVVEEGILSRFLGCWHEEFYGGKKVRSLEEEWAAYYGVKHAMAVNSATSGLQCALGAAGVGPGDEVIVSPYTMSASASSTLVFNAVPVFADIEPDYFCLDPDSVESRITERTKAIVVVDIFGQPYDADRINAIARKHNLLVIEDAAQAPGATYNGKLAGTLGDIGVFSLNYHKHIHSGEGGVVVTNDDHLADRVRLIRNHAEVVVEGMGVTELSNMIGFNMRMTELEAAIGSEQLKKLSALLPKRIENVEYLANGLTSIPCLKPAAVRPGCTHVFYKHVLLYDDNVAGISRNRFIEAVKAELMPNEMREPEGIQIGCGYVRPIYMEPMFQKQIAYGKNGCPFKCPWYKGAPNYSKGICPTCETLHERTLITHEYMLNAMTKKDMDDVIEAFRKVWTHREELV